MKDSQNEISRRQFFACAGTLGTAVFLGQAGLAQTTIADPTAPDAMASGARADNAPGEDVIPLQDTPDPYGSMLVLTLNQHPELGKIGGWKILEWNESSVIVVHTENGFSMYSAICPHKGCEVVYKPEEKQFLCPCHHARFDLEGQVVLGPAKSPLQKFDVLPALVVRRKTSAKSPTP